MVLKAELHCHIEGAARPELVIRLARKYGVDVSDVIDQSNCYICHDFSSFIHASDVASSVFREPGDYRLLAYDHFTGLAAQDCIYAEIFVTPDHGARFGLSYPDMINAIAGGIGDARQETGIEGRIITIGMRHLGPEAVENAADLAAQNPHPMVTGFGMAGDERAFNPEDFATAFAIAADAGLSLTAHAGELDGAESVRGAIDHLNVSRIGHGVRSIEDPILVQRLIEENIALEVCPGSNLAMRLFPSIHEHPFKVLRNTGVQVTLSSDNPPFFNTSITQEYDRVASHFKLSDSQLKDITRNSIDSAFVDEPTRQKLLTRLDIST